MLNCLIGDSITRIRNGYRAKLQEVELYYSNFVLSFVKVLKEEGYIEDFEIFQEGVKRSIGVNLRYYKDKPAMKRIKLISRPGQRIYTKKDKIPIIANYLGSVILSTNKGLMTSKDARNAGLGGEIIAEVF